MILRRQSVAAIDELGEIARILPQMRTKRKNIRSTTDRKIALGVNANARSFTGRAFYFLIYDDPIFPVPC